MLPSEVASGVQLPNSWFILGVPPIAFSQRNNPTQKCNRCRPIRSNLLFVPHKRISTSIPHAKRMAENTCVNS